MIYILLPLFSSVFLQKYFSGVVFQKNFWHNIGNESTPEIKKEPDYEKNKFYSY